MQKFQLSPAIQEVLNFRHRPRFPLEYCLALHRTFWLEMCSLLGRWCRKWSCLSVKWYGTKHCSESCL